MSEHRISTQRLRQLASRLRRDWPANYPVEILKATRRLKGLRSECGESNFNEGRQLFQIWLNRELPTRVVEDTLLHEWAHLLTWEDHTFHNRVWAAKYAALTRWMSHEREWSGYPDEPISR